MNTIEQVWNAVTSNGMREMDEERFKQAAEELLSIQRQELIKELESVYTKQMLTQRAEESLEHVCGLDVLDLIHWAVDQIINHLKQK